MKAAVLTGIRKMEVKEVPLPSIKNDTDVLLKILAVGVCGSDIQYYARGGIGSDMVRFPFIVGHECVAEVEQTGGRVRRALPGDRVVVDPAITCGTCDQCFEDRPNTCRNLLFLGCPGQMEGCLAEYIVMPESNCHPFHKATKVEQAILVEPLSIGIYAIRLLEKSVATSLAVLGSGPIGLSVALAASEKGILKIYMTDRIDQRVEAARKAGAVWSGNPDRSDVVGEILEREPLGLDAVFECCGDQEAIDQAIELLKPGGKLMIIGIPDAERTSFDAHRLRRKEIGIHNVRRQNDCIPAAIDLAGQLGNALDFMVTHVFPLEQTQEAFDMVENYRDGVIKAVIRPSKEHPLRDYIEPSLKGGLSISG
jgi:L-iditol 2-dehydrogenase